MITSELIISLGTPELSGYSGDGSAASAALLSSPNTLACDSLGNIYFSSGSNSVLRVLVLGKKYTSCFSRCTLYTALTLCILIFVL